MPGFKLGDLFAKIPMPRFGDLLYQHRTLHGMSVEELATAVNIAPSALRDMEAGDHGVPLGEFDRNFRIQRNIPAE